MAVRGGRVGPAALASLSIGFAVTACSTSPGTPSPPPASVGTVSNVLMTDLTRAEIVAAEDAHAHLGAAAIDGVHTATARFAYDSKTKTFWAGAALVASAQSSAAKRALTGGGRYLLFRRLINHKWQVFEVGNSGSTGCPVTLPPDLLTAWNWAPGTCAPPGVA